MTTLPKDKLLHIAAGAAISLAVGLLTGTPWLGAAAAVVAGFGKELYDRQHPDKHTPDMLDAIATAVAGAVAAGVLGALTGS